MEWYKLPKPKSPVHWFWVFFSSSLLLAWLSRPAPVDLVFHNTTLADLELVRTPADPKRLALVEPLAQERCGEVRIFFPHQFSISGERLSDTAYYVCDTGWLGNPLLSSVNEYIYCSEEYAGEKKVVKRSKEVNVTYTQNAVQKTTTFTGVDACTAQFAHAILHSQW